MSLNRRDLVLAGLAAAALPTVALAAAEKAPVPAKKAFPFYDLFLDVPPAERSRFTMSFYLKVNDRPATSTVLFLTMPGGVRTPLTVGAEGRLTRMPNRAELKDGMVEAVKGKPGDKVQLAMEFEPLVRMGETIATADLHAAIEQCNTAIRKRAGLIGFAAPKVEQVIFAGTSAGAAVLAGGKTAPLPLVKGMAAYRPAALPGAQSLTFTRAPARAFLAGKAT